MRLLSKFKNSIMEYNYGSLSPLNIDLWELVELVIPNNTTARLNFTPQPQLRTQSDQDIWVKNIEVFPVSVQTHAFSDTSVVVMPNAEIPKAALVLYSEGWEKEHIVPLAKLIHINDGTVPFQPWMQFFTTLSNVAWEKSYVLFNTPPANTPYAIPFGVSYLRALQKPVQTF